MGARSWISLVVAATASVFPLGCIPTLPLRHLSYDAVAAPPISRARLEFAAAAESPANSSLADLIDIAGQHHPDLRWARGRIESARGQFIQAGLYPNPIIGPRITQLGHGENNWGEAGATFTQTIVTKNKLGLARQAAERGIEAADWRAITKWNDVVTRVRLTYFELLTVKRELETLKNILRVSEDAVKTAETLEKAGAGNRPDVLRARVELEQNRLRWNVSLRRAEAASQNLFTSLGRPKIALEDLLPKDGRELDVAPPEFDWNCMVEHLREISSELQEARAVIVQNERLIAKAQADVTPNVDVNLIPYYAAYDQEMRGLVAVTVPLPIYDRNQGNIRAAKGNYARVIAEEQQVELRLIDGLTVAYQRYQANRQQANTFREVIVPQARESLKLVEAGYRGGDKKYDYTTVLQAQQILFQAQLNEAQALGELWRSVSEIAGILQQSQLDAGCMARR